MKAGRTGRRRGWLARFIRRCCRSIFLIPPSPPASPGNAASRDGPGGEPPRSPRAPLRFRGTHGWIRSLRRGEAGRDRGGRWGVPDSGKERGGGNTPDQCCIPRGSCQPRGQRGQRAHAQTLHKASRTAAPPCSSTASSSGCNHTPHLRFSRLAGTTRPQGQASAPWRATLTCAHLHARTLRPRGHGAAPAAQTHRTPATRSHRLPRLHSDASERDGWQGSRDCTIPGGAARGREVVLSLDAPCTPRLGVGPHSLPPPRTHCWPCCG